MRRRDSTSLVNQATITCQGGTRQLCSGVSRDYHTLSSYTYMVRPERYEVNTCDMRRFEVVILLHGQDDLPAFNNRAGDLMCSLDDSHV